MSVLKMAKGNDYYQGKDAVLQKVRLKLRPPALYKVIIINDDYTPMDFVVHVLQSFFGMNTTLATRIMLDVHNSGKGICGIFSKEIAEMKVKHVNSYSRENQHPLLCTMEKE